MISSPFFCLESIYIPSQRRGDTEKNKTVFVRIHRIKLKFLLNQYLWNLLILNILFFMLIEV